jgi:hypothetical protein
MVIYGKFTGLEHWAGGSWEQIHKGLFMFHQNVSSALRSVFLPVSSASSHFSSQPDVPGAGLPGGSVLRGELLPFPDRPRLDDLPAKSQPRVMADLLSAAANRFAAFCAEASVLVFVLGILDRFLLKERIEMGWIGGALVVSLVLLAMSVATDLGARRWLKIRKADPVAH